MSKKRRFYKATEAEMMLQVTREKEGFTGKTEKISMKNIIETARRNGRIGDKDLVVVPPKYVHIPKWQRRLDITRSERIGFHYDKNKWEVPKVIYNDGILECVDGMHRIFGAYLGNIDGVVVEVLDINEKEAIELFLNQTMDRSNMRPHDYLNASLEIEKPEYIAFRKICHKYNVQIKGDDTLRNPVGTFTSLSDGINICKRNPETLENILGIICKLNWNKLNSDKGNAFCAKYIRIFKKLYGYYEDRMDEMDDILLDNCSGADWFKCNAETVTQSQLFDYLSGLIQDNLAMECKPEMLRAV